MDHHSYLYYLGKRNLEGLTGLKPSYCFSKIKKRERHQNDKDAFLIYDEDDKFVQ